MRFLVVLIAACLILSHWRPSFWLLPSSGLIEVGLWLDPPQRTPPQVALIEVDHPESLIWGRVNGDASRYDPSLVRAVESLTAASKTIGIILPFPVDLFDLDSAQLERLLEDEGDNALAAVRAQIQQQQHMRELLESDQVVLGLRHRQTAEPVPLDVQTGSLASVVPFLRAWLWPVEGGVQQVPASGLRYFSVMTQPQAEQSFVLEEQGNVYPGFTLELLYRSLRNAAGPDGTEDFSRVWRRDSNVLENGLNRVPLSSRGTLIPLVDEYHTMSPSFARLSLSAAALRPVDSSIVLIGSRDDPILERTAASVVSLVEGLVLTEPRWFAPAQKIVLLILMAVFLLLLPRLKFRFGLAFCIGLALVLVSLQLCAQLLWHWWTPVADFLWYVPAAFVVMQIWQRKQKEQEAQVRLRLPNLSESAAVPDKENAEQVDRPAEPVPASAPVAHMPPPREVKNPFRRVQEIWQQGSVTSPGHSARDNLATTVVMELENPLVLGRYEIQQELGRGASGIVYLAYDPKISRKVAIKTLNFRNFDEPQLRDIKARFFREATAAGRLNHPHIVSVFDVGEEQELAFIAMDYVDGQPLSKHVSETTLLSPFEAYRAAAHVARALHYAHQNNIIHRDIKPANIIYSAEPYQLKVTDFGIARLVDESRTSTGEILGSPLYMAPEQLRGKTVTPGADLFSLGVTFYQLLSGQLPFKGDNLASLTYDIIYGKPQSVRKVFPELPTSATRIINRALQKDAAKRFESALEMAEAIEKAMRRDFPDEAKAVGYIV